jgi:hypothetical protein
MPSQKTTKNKVKNIKKPSKLIGDFRIVRIVFLIFKCTNVIHQITKVGQTCHFHWNIPIIPLFSLKTIKGKKKKKNYNLAIQTTRHSTDRLPNYQKVSKRSGLTKIASNIPTMCPFTIKKKYHPQKPIFF